MSNVPDFRPGKKKIEEFSLKKANVATLAPESKPKVYSAVQLQHCATKEIRPYWRIFCLENQVHFLRWNSKITLNTIRDDATARAHQIYPQNYKLTGFGPLFSQKGPFSIKKNGFPFKRLEDRKFLGGLPPPPLFQTGGAGPPLAPMVATPLWEGAA